eukprot:2204177-Karenia_brevis.AAC.1
MEGERNLVDLQAKEMTRAKESSHRVWQQSDEGYRVFAPGMATKQATGPMDQDRKDPEEGSGDFAP